MQRMVLADISVNGIFSTPITFGLEDEEEDAEGLASVVEDDISTSNAPEMSDADSESSNSGNEADEDKEDTNNKDEDEDKEDKNNKDEEKENQDTTTTGAPVRHPPSRTTTPLQTAGRLRGTTGTWKSRRQRSGRSARVQVSLMWIK